MHHPPGWFNIEDKGQKKKVERNNHQNEIKI